MWSVFHIPHTYIETHRHSHHNTQQPYRGWSNYEKLWPLTIGLQITTTKTHLVNNFQCNGIDHVIDNNTQHRLRLVSRVHEFISCFQCSCCTSILKNMYRPHVVLIHIIIKHVSVQLPTSADNVALLAFAAEHQPCSNHSIFPGDQDHRRKPAAMACNCQMTGLTPIQMDDQQFQRPCAAHYVRIVNNVQLLSIHAIVLQQVNSQMSSQHYTCH